MFLRNDTIRQNIARLGKPTISKTKGFLNQADLLSYKIDSVFVSAMNEAEGRTRELISHYRESRETEENMVTRFRRNC